MNKLLLFLCFVFFVLFSSCQDDPCDEKIESLVGINFRTIDSTGNDTDTLLPSLAIYSPENNNTLLRDTATDVNETTLPLAPSKDMSTFVLSFDSVTDTLYFYYQRDIKLVSQDCGFRTIFHLDSIHYSHSAIDSLQIIDKTVNSADAKHLEIFLF
jgi:hypothetical protein